MSYEGYDNVFCMCGHYQDSFYCYDSDLREYEASKAGESKKECPVCGCKQFVFESIDETNWEPVVSIMDAGPINFSIFKCDKCKDGETTTTRYIKKNCECGGKNKICPKCYGTGIVMVPEGVSKHQCVDCNGRGEKFEPIYDISKLIAR